jgi:hypothetical protein
MDKWSTAVKLMGNNLSDILFSLNQRYHINGPKMLPISRAPMLFGKWGKIPFLRFGTVSCQCEEVCAT